MHYIKSFESHLREEGKAEKTIQSYTGDTMGFLTYLKSKELSFDGILNRFAINSYKSYLIKENYEPTTINKKLNSLQSFNDFESFTISGNWANAEEILVSIDDVNWTSYSGDSFEQTLNANFLGVNKIIIVAKNTLDASDPDYTIETIKYPIKVNSNGVYTSSLDSTSVTVKLDLEKYEGREVQLENVNTLEALTKTPYMSYLCFSNLVSNNPYKIKLIENGTVVSVINFITGVDSIAIENVQQEVNSCNLMSVQY
jgi:hypothetical protein